MSGTSWLRIGASSGALAVILGTFLAHGLRVPPEKLDEMPLKEQRETIRRMEVFDIGTRYQMYHALAMVAVGLAIAASPKPTPAWLNASGWAFLAGTVLFPGSLYALGLGGPKWLGMIAPFGGLSFIAGWVLMAVGTVDAGRSKLGGDVGSLLGAETGENARTERMLTP